MLGFQPHWAAGLIEDQLLAAVDDFLAEIDRGLCMADLGAEKSREAFDTLFGRLSDLRAGSSSSNTGTRTVRSESR